MNILFPFKRISVYCLLAALGAASPCFGQDASKVPAGGASGGVGIILDYDPPGSGNIAVYSVSYKSPADKARVQRGSQLLKVDGQEVTGKALTDVATLIRGPVGSTVTLTLNHPTAGIQEVALVRQAVTAGPPVALPPPSQVGGGSGQEENLSEQEKGLVKQKILGLKTELEQQRMMELLQQLQAKRISKQQFMQTIQKEFP